MFQILDPHKPKSLSLKYFWYFGIELFGYLFSIFHSLLFTCFCKGFEISFFCHIFLCTTDLKAPGYDLFLFINIIIFSIFFYYIIII